MIRRLVVGGLGGAVAIEVREGTLGPERDADFVSRLETAWSRALLPDDTPVSETLSPRLGASTVDPLALDSTEELLNTLTQTITHALIRARQGELLMFHAGGIAHPDTGRSVVVVAPGGTGKTTLTSTLCRDFGYLSDETIGMTADGDILPYPKPLSVRGTDGPKDEVSPDALGLRPAPTTPVLAKLVLLSRVPEADGVTIEALGTLDAIVDLVSETSSLSRFPHPLQALAGLLRSTGGAERWTYAEHTDVLPRARQLLGAP